MRHVIDDAAKLVIGKCYSLNFSALFPGGTTYSLHCPEALL